MARVLHIRQTRVVQAEIAGPGIQKVREPAQVLIGCSSVATGIIADNAHAAIVHTFDKSLVTVSHQHILAEFP